MTLPFVRNPYNYDVNEASDQAGLKCEDQSLTQQSFLEESDINFIAERYGLTGELPQVLHIPQYGDFTGVFDFQSAQNAVRLALEQFMELPAKVRARFDNNPQKLLDFMDDPENKPEAELLGLITKPKPDAPQAPTATPAPGATPPVTPPTPTP